MYGCDVAADITSLLVLDSKLGFLFASDFHEHLFECRVWYTYIFK
jgi:hypothetical protein